MRAFCYCRVSTEEQSTDDHYSLANQEKKAKDYAKIKGWQVVRTRKDVASGKDTNRSGFQELVSCVKAHEIDLVLVYRLDRLSRNVRDIYDMLDLMKEHDVAFVSISEGFDTTTAMGRAMLGVAAVFAQLTREMIAENVKDGLMRRAESGKWNGPKWNPPYGYRYVVGGTIEPIPEQAEIIKRIFRWFTQEKWGTMKIARILNTQGIMRESAMPGSGQWHQSKIWEMLGNPVYAGYLTAGEKLVDGNHEPIVDQRTWESTKEIMASRRKQAPRTKASPYLLSGLVRCGTCNRAMVAQKGRYKNSAGEHTYYAFRHSPNEYSGEMHCPGVYHRGDTLETAVIADIMELAKTPELREAALAAAHEKVRDNEAPVKDEISQLSARLSELDALFEEWADRLDRHIINESQFRNHNTMLMAEREKLSRRLEELQARTAGSLADRVTVDQVEKALTDMPMAWENLQFEERKELLRLLIDRIAVFRDRVEVQLFHLPTRVVHAKRAEKDNSPSPVPGASMSSC